MWISSKWTRGTEFISTLFWILVHLWDFHWLELILEIYAFFSLTYRNSDSSGLSGANLRLLKSYCRQFVSLQNVQWTLIQAHWCMVKPWWLLSIHHGLVTSVDPRWLTETLVIYFKVFCKSLFSLLKVGLMSLRMMPVCACESGKSKWAGDFSSKITISHLNL